MKVVVVGNIDAGKTALINRMVKDQFSMSYHPTIGVDVKKSTIDGRRITLIDISGDLRFRSIMEQYFKNSSHFIVCFDCGNRKSFEDTQDWIKNIRKMCKNPYIVLCATKTDKQNRVVSTYEGEDFALRQCIDYIETSSRNNEGVTQCLRLVTPPKDNISSCPPIKNKNCAGNCCIVM